MSGAARGARVRGAAAAARAVDRGGDLGARGGGTQYAAAGNPFAIAPFTAFLEQHPASVWWASRRANLGGLHRGSGYYTRAWRAWDEAWALSKDDRSVQGRAIADFTAVQALDMPASMGQVGGLDRWLQRTKDRAMIGPGRRESGARR